VEGFRREWAEAIAGRRPFAGFSQLASAGLPHAALVALAEADALRGVGLDRRAALWQVRGLDRAAPLPLFADLPVSVRKADLPVMALAEQVTADYRTTGLSLKAHPMRFLRAGLVRQKIMSCAEAIGLRNGAVFHTVGVVLVRQRPGGGSVVFVTIEDETGTANVVIWASLLEQFRSAILGASVLGVQGRVQRSGEGIVHLVAEVLENRTGALRTVEDELPRSRDFR
jgi:error-prone DNA polymerase